MNNGVALDQLFTTPDYDSQIEAKRFELFRIAKRFGMYSDETLRCSQELDLLIACEQENCFPF